MVGLRSLSQRTRPGGVLTASWAWQSTSNQLVHTRCWNAVDCYRLDDDGDDGDDDIRGVVMIRSFSGAIDFTQASWYRPLVAKCTSSELLINQWLSALFLCIKLIHELITFRLVMLRMMMTGRAKLGPILILTCWSKTVSLGQRKWKSWNWKKNF